MWCQTRMRACLRSFLSLQWNNYGRIPRNWSRRAQHKQLEISWWHFINCRKNCAFFFFLNLCTSFLLSSKNCCYLKTVHVLIYNSYVSSQIQYAYFKNSYHFSPLSWLWIKLWYPQRRWKKHLGFKINKNWIIVSSDVIANWKKIRKWI